MEKNTVGNPSLLSAIAGVTVIIGTLISIRNSQRLSMIHRLGEIDKDSSTVQAREREIGQVCPRDCVGCDIVQADHAPEAGVAQGIFHGILVRHRGRNQEEVEEGLEDEVERRGEENTQEQVRMPMTMDGNDADANET